MGKRAKRLKWYAPPYLQFMPSGSWARTSRDCLRSASGKRKRGARTVCPVVRSRGLLVMLIALLQQNQARLEAGTAQHTGDNEEQ